MTHKFHSTVLREYDIRGIIGETLGPDDARAIGRSFGSLLTEAGGRKVAVGYDGRVSSPMLEHALIEGLTASGCDVVRIGMGATPMLYYAEASREDVDGGIQITGSHNPANYNGFKMVFQGRPFFGADIQKLGEISANGEWVDGTGNVESHDILQGYVDRMLQGLNGIDPDLLAGLKVGWDEVPGLVAEAVDPKTHVVLGDPFPVTLPRATVRQLRQREERGQLGVLILKGVLLPQVMVNPDRNEQGLFDKPRFVGPFAEFEFFIEASSVTPPPETKDRPPQRTPGRS